MGKLYFYTSSEMDLFQIPEFSGSHCIIYEYFNNYSIKNKKKRLSDLLSAVLKIRTGQRSVNKR